MKCTNVWSRELHSNPWAGSGCHCGHQHPFAFGETEAGAAPALLGVTGMSQGAGSSALGRAVPFALCRLSQQKAGEKHNKPNQTSQNFRIVQLPGCKAPASQPLRWGKRHKEPERAAGPGRVGTRGWSEGKGNEAPGFPLLLSRGVTREMGFGMGGDTGSPAPPLPSPRTTTPGEPRARVTRPRRDRDGVSGAQLDRDWLSRTGTGPAPPPCR